MISQRIERLTQLLQIKHQATQKIYLDLVKAREQFNQNKAKHDQLVVYRQDYLQQLERLGSEGSSVGQLRNRIDFINHLDTALIQLNAHLGQIAKLRSKLELNYKQAKISEEGVAKLIGRVNEMEQIKLQRMEQKENDEYAQKQGYNRKINDQSNTFSE